jgi:hypothetical protein
MMPRRSASTKAADYDVHPSIAYLQAVVDNLPAKTGKSIDEWARLIERSAPAETSARRDWLKKEHKIGGTTAWMIVARTEGDNGPDTNPKAYLVAAPGYVDAMYAGAKSGLRPIHDALVMLARSLGRDVKVSPCQTIVPLYRNHVFAQVKPTTRTRIDFGLALKGAKGKLPKRLIDTGGIAKGDRISHRIEVTSLEEIDEGLTKWLRVAYDLDA